MSQISINSNNLSNLKIGVLRAKWNAANTRILRYYIDLSHNILGLHKELSAPELDILQNKVNVLVASWDNKYDLFLIKQAQSDGKQRAVDLTVEAEEYRKKLGNILSDTLKIDDKVEWERLKSKEVFKLKKFPKDKPRKPASVSQPSPLRISIWDKIIGRDKKKKVEYENAIIRIEEELKLHNKAYEKKLERWESEKEIWEQDQHSLAKVFNQKKAKANAEVDKLHQAWLNGNSEAVIEHSTMVLDASDYPGLVEKNFDLQYEKSEKILLVEYQLPDPESIPKTKSVRYIASSDEFRETKISQKEARDLYDQICYQVCLRTLHEVFEADTPNHISAVVFNGVCRTVSKATGKEIESTIMSLMVSKPDFLDLNLDRIEPKSCFRTLKGVAAASLSGLASIAPVMILDKSDKRFIDSRPVNVDHSTNIAAMDWEQFEHLVRELFEKEFSSRGGEVKVTQSSSDGGVDAVAFDPDPISGGKIVIQAKRYTKTVGVAAVRDLYGTILSEGASKGILVTTADYGPEAYKFATGKPITLLNGSNLLHLLEKHGTRATIDLAAARTELGLSNS